MRNKGINLSVVGVLFFLCQACSHTVPVSFPEVSKYSYQSKEGEKEKQLSFKNGLADNHAVSSGVLKVNLKIEGENLDAEEFFIKNLSEELEARKLPVAFSASSDYVLELQNFQILTHRVSGFSPLVTLSSAKAELRSPAGATEHLVAFLKRGKLPVWTMSEVNEPCYNQPLALLVKEMAAKINRALFDYSISDADVEALANKIRDGRGDKRLIYLDVYELGFSNNLRAISHLKELTSHSDDYIRMAAISGLGMLGSDDQLELLKSIYLEADLWQDRGMALKAIGDLRTEKSLGYLREQKERWQDGSSREAKWNTMIANLFLL